MNSTPFFLARIGALLATTLATLAAAAALLSAAPAHAASASGLSSPAAFSDRATPSPNQ